MSTAEKKQPMTPEERQAILTEIHANLDSIPEDQADGYAVPSWWFLSLFASGITGFILYFLVIVGVKRLSEIPQGVLAAVFFLFGLVTAAIINLLSNWSWRRFSRRRGR